MKPFLLCLVLLTTLSACASPETRYQAAFTIAQRGGLHPFKIDTGLFGLAGFYKKGTGSEAVLYIEGDGFAWIDRYTISGNPTPKNPLALKLAALDTAANVFYLARPCQYVALTSEPNCSDSYWSTARFAPEVIDAFDRALDRIRAVTGMRAFHLVGFSGGGAVAALLAARRDDITSLRTIAGNLDPVALNAAKKVSPLTGSLNPMQIAEKINRIPQIHYSGAEDQVVPGWVAGNFARAGDNPGCIRPYSVSGAGHMNGWEKFWKTHHGQSPNCQGASSTLILK